jgi:hypothetical protein
VAAVLVSAAFLVPGMVLLLLLLLLVVVCDGGGSEVFHGDW